MKLTVFLALIFSSVVFAKVIQEKVVIENYRWLEDKKLYRLTIYGKAGVYWIDQKHLECISFSVKNNTQVSVIYDLKTLLLSDCYTN